jgi:hypothetical protein
MANFIDPKKQSRGMLLAVMAALTLALVAGIKFIMSDDTSSLPEQPAQREQLFKEPPPPQGLNPAARSETGSGGGLDMFSKTNAGYYGEEESTATAAAQGAAAPEVRKSTAVAPRKPAAKARKKGTVIPRMKSGSFGAISPTNVAPGGAGQNMPDLSGMIKQAQQRSGGGGD